MPRYIDADAFLKKIERYSLSNGTTLGKHSGVADEIIDILMAEPTADVAEVVRCKDCVWWEARTFGSTIGRCENPRNGLVNEYSEETDFCSYGERKE